VNGVSVLEKCGTMQALTFTRSYHSTLLFSTISVLFVVSDCYYTCALSFNLRAAVIIPVGTHMIFGLGYFTFINLFLRTLQIYCTRTVLTNYKHQLYIYIYIYIYDHTIITNVMH